jgi:hypothetical protein
MSRVIRRRKINEHTSQLVDPLGVFGDTREWLVRSIRLWTVSAVKRQEQKDNIIRKNRAMPDSDKE